jgi:ATP-dependent DNA helicase PIF1
LAKPPVSDPADIAVTRPRAFGGFRHPPSAPAAPTDPESFVRDDAYEASPGVREALAAVDDGRPAILVTGRAGTGKTRLVHYLRERPGGDKQAVVAPTGVAALNARAQTIHSFFQLPFGVLDARRLTPPRNTGKLFRRMERLVIDEVSMVRADVLDAIDARLRQSRGDDRPFGGVQVVLVGDFLQLPPVVERDHMPILQALGYATPFAFSAKALDDAGVETIELDHVYRQEEQAFVDILAKLRTGDDVDDAVRRLNERCMKPHRDGVVPILLTPTRAAAERYNRDGIERIAGTVVEYAARIDGKLEIAQDRLPVPERLELKIGARVMAVRNDLSRRWVNGSLGTVTALEPERVMVRFDHDSASRAVERAVWEKVRQEWNDASQSITSTSLAAYSQIPLLPAWAITIHKAQGLSLDDVRLDLGRGAFASGQLYVALSRARTLDGLSLTRTIRAADVMVDPMLLDFVHWLRT